MDANEQEINKNSADYDLFEDIGPVHKADSSSPSNDISCSPEDYNVLFENHQSASNQWRDIEAPSPYNTSATVDCICQQLFLVDLIFGPRSNIGHLLAEKLTISDENLLKNLRTYFLVAAYNLSQVQIYSKHSFVNIDGC